MMKIILTPEFPDFYLNYRGMVGQLHLSNYPITDRNGKKLYNIHFAYAWTREEMGYCNSSLVVEFTFKSKLQCFFNVFATKNLGIFKNTQEEILNNAVNYVIKRIDETVDERNSREKVFDSLSLEQEIPAN